MRNLLLILLALVVFGCKNNADNKTVHAKRVMKAHPGWDSAGNGIRGIVNALAVYHDELYAAGSIDSAGGKPISGIAKWNGKNWSPVGKGIKGNITSLAVFNDELYAGGFFDSADGKPYSCLAKWNGSHWSDVDTIVDIIALAATNNKLYAAGYYDTIEDETSHSIGCWNGEKWDTIYNPDKRWEIKSLYVYRDTLYAGGNMGKDSSLIKLTKKGWVVINKPIHFEVNAMAEYEGELYLAGNDAEGNNRPHIASLGEKGLTNPGKGIIGHIKSLAVYNDKLYAAGQFAMVNEKYAGCISRWDGENWQVIDGGVNLNDIPLERICLVTPANMPLYIDTVVGKVSISYDTLAANIFINSLAEYKGELYIAGKFDVAGGVPVHNIARYKEQAKQL
ncbi:MAG: hypothetical protein ACLQQ4_00165 [Bacteroidia bacterium]